MQCSACGSQDTTLKQGISKSGKNAGKPWKAYDCNEPQCKNEKGYPTRTFVPTPKAASQQVQTSNGNIEKKVDQILAILKANFTVARTEVAHEDIPNIEEEPF